MRKAWRFRCGRLRLSLIHILLDIFASRASTSEGKIQVELAQLKYRQSRLTGFGTALSRLGGGIGTRGPGEKKLEMDRRLIKGRIAQLNRELKDVKRHREVTREQRSRNRIPVAAIVGYTNAGKSTLLNTLTGAGILAEDKLFATLDPTTRELKLPSGQEILLTDTVGFIRKLPHHLIEAFRSTLEEARYADIILHVVDAANPQMDEQMYICLLYTSCKEDRENRHAECSIRAGHQIPCHDSWIHRLCQYVDGGICRHRRCNALRAEFNPDTVCRSK